MAACGDDGDPSSFDTGGASGGGPDDGQPGDTSTSAGGDTTDGASGAIPPDGVWRTLAPLGEGPRQETGVAALDGEVYVVGGFALGGGLVPRVEAYDPATDSWRTLGDFPTIGVHHANLATVGGRIWALGHLTGLTFDAVGDVWSYDPAKIGRAHV